MRFLKNVFNELKQVTWLSKGELLKTTFSVVISSIMLAGFVYSIDVLASEVYGSIVKMF